MLRKDIVNRNVFINKSEEVVDYLEIKCPHFSYTYLLSDDVVKSRIEKNESMIIKECMKQHLMVFTKNEPILCKGYLCSCSSCLEFNAREMKPLVIPNCHALITMVTIRYCRQDGADFGFHRSPIFCLSLQWKSE